MRCSGASPCLSIFDDAPQCLSHFDPLPLLYRPMPPCRWLARLGFLRRGFEDQDNGAAQLESTHLLTPSERVSAENGAGVLIGGFSEPKILLAALRSFLSSFVSSCICEQTICSKLTIKIDLDRANVRCPDRDKAEETISPSSQKYDALVQREKARQSSLKVWRNAEQLAGKVTPSFHHPVGWRVESVVVAWRQVDDSVVQ